MDNLPITHRPTGHHLLRSSDWPGYAAGGWAIAHALLSAYWAAGGWWGIGLLSEGVVELATQRATWFVVLLIGTAAAKLILAGLALATVCRWGRIFPPRPLIFVVGGTGILMVLYAVANLAIGGLAFLGLINIEGTPDPAFRWYLLLWHPLWLAGGMLFTMAAMKSRGRLAADI